MPTATRSRAMSDRLKEASGRIGEAGLAFGTVLGRELVVLAGLPAVQRLLATATLLLVFSMLTVMVERDIANLPRFKVPLAELDVSPPPNFLSSRVSAEVSKLALPRESFQAFDPRLVPTLQHALSCLPWVDRVESIRVELPDKVRFSVSLLQPLALVRWKGEPFAVAIDGRTFPRTYLDGFDLEGSPQLPLIVGLEASRDGGEVLSATLAFIEDLKARGVLERAKIRSVDISNIGGRRDPKNSEIVLETSAGMKIDWGRLPESGRLQLSAEERIKRLDEFLKAGPKPETVDRLSLRWEDTTMILRPPPAEPTAGLAQR